MVSYSAADTRIEEAQKTNTEALDLSGLQLTSLPASLALLTKLKTLNLSNNKLEVLPQFLGKLTKLESLNLSDNRLSSWPQALSQLANLKLLDLRGNQFSSLSDSLGLLTQVTQLNFSRNRLTSLPESLGLLQNLQILGISNNQFKDLPSVIGTLRGLRNLQLGVRYTGGNPLQSLPSCIRQLTNLEILFVDQCELVSLPEWLGELGKLKQLELACNGVSDLPVSLGRLDHLGRLDLNDNPLNPELAAAYESGVDAVKLYLRSKAFAHVPLREAKLILVGEGEVGKSCLLGALRGDEWTEGRPTTHGIEIKPVNVTDPDSGMGITLNGWDFGGQRVYRPTHQLFFSAPAVYLVVWKPREGPQQGFVKEWIRLVQHREPEARILVVATHGGPGQRQPDVDRQELWDLFGRDTVRDFFLVDSKPDPQTGERHGIPELRDAIARIAASLPEMGRLVPATWQQAREALQHGGAAYMSLERVFAICGQCMMSEEETSLFVSISHRLGHLIHYEHDPTLRDIVVLKPDWLATAISFVLDDKQTRDGHGLVSASRLDTLWDNPAREKQFRYSHELHSVFLRLMERFDLSYRIAVLPEQGVADCTSLIAQLVPDVRPDPIPGWPIEPSVGDQQQVQICRVVECGSRQSAASEGLFYQLIVRLHKYSLGRANFADSVHWQRGLVLDDDYNGRALLEHLGNDVRITVRAAYPERFLSVLTNEVKWLVENFWAGLRCDVMVPCVVPCGRDAPGTGLFEVQKLIQSKKRERPEYPCPVCNEWQSIDRLLRNAAAAQPSPAEELLAMLIEAKRELYGVRLQLLAQHGETLRRFDGLDAATHRIISQVDAVFAALLHSLTSEAKDGPRLFSIEPVDTCFLDQPKWISQKFRLTLWCEHSRLPLPSLNAESDSRGVYELNLSREWLTKAAPFLKVLMGTLALVLPVASSATKLVLEDNVFKRIEKELDLGQKSIEAVLKGGEAGESSALRSQPLDLEAGQPIQAHGPILRQLHAWLKEKDPGFGGLVRVLNRRHEFLWVHPRFEEEY